MREPTTRFGVEPKEARPVKYVSSDFLSAWDLTAIDSGMVCFTGTLADWRDLAWSARGRVGRPDSHASRTSINVVDPRTLEQDTYAPRQRYYIGK